MKALTNILTHMLMLLLMVALATCTTDDGADVVMPMDDGMVQLKVGMTVPNLKITTRAADEGETLNAIKGLCYDENGTLTKIADATDITTTTFNMRVPAETRTIHFLANLPGGYTLPAVWTTTEDALQNLTTQSPNMTYWGRTTFNSTPADCNITFYRNKARIFIKAADGSNVGTVGIAGVVNAYDTGMLVPYNDGAYNFDLSNNDYPTVPTEGFTKDNEMEYTDPLPTQYDVFEHPNTGTSQASSLYAICLIGSKYYKVALGTPDEDGMVTEHYFPIIRNHKYVISVADVDDVDASLGADLPNDAVNLAPINDPNIKVEDVVDVVVTLSTSTATLDYNTTSISNLILSVTVPPEVDKLTLSTPGFTVATFSDTSYKIDEDTNQYYLVKNDDGSFTVNHPENDEEHTFSFRLKLDDNPQQSSYNLSCTATSNDANVQITQPEAVTISLNKVADDANVYWMGASPLVYSNSPSKIPISAAKLTKGATVTFEYVKGEGNADIGLQHAGWNNFVNIPTLDLSQSTTSFKITQELYNEIQSNTGWIYEVENAGMVIQGQNITLTKITIDPTEDVSLTVNPTTASLYYDSDNKQEITVTVPGGKTLTELTITPSEDCFTITPATGELTGPANGVYTYAPDGGVTGSVTFTIAPSDSYNFTSNLTPDVVFDGTGVDMNVVEAKTTVTLTAKPAITATADKETLYYDTNNQTTTVTVNIPKGVSALSITATDFTVTQYNNSVGNYDNGTYTLNNTNSEQTVQFVFTMNNVSSTSDKTSTTIEFSDNSGVATSPSPITISLTEKPAEVTGLVVTPVGITTIDLGEGDNKTVRLTLSIPKQLTYMQIYTGYAFEIIGVNGSEGPTENGDSYFYYSISPGSISTIELEFSMNSEIFPIGGSFPVRFYTDPSDKSQYVETTIDVINSSILDKNILWVGEVAITDPPFLIKEQLIDYVGSTLKMDIIKEGTDWQVQADGLFSAQWAWGVEQPDDMTLEKVLDENLNDEIYFRGKGVTIKKIYIEPAT